jgi:alkylation response protein AidB-like acyl-CoA dehydrogenase
MNFLLSEEQEQLLETVRDFAVERGNAGARRAAFEGEEGFESGFWRALMELGAGGIVIPAEYNGMEREIIDLALICEALGYAGAPGPYLGHVLAGLAIALSNDTEAKQKWLPKLASGEALGSIAFGETGGRWLPDQWQAKLIDEKLQGTKFGVFDPLHSDVIVAGTTNGFALVDKNVLNAASVATVDVVDRTRRFWTVNFTGVAAQPLRGAPELRQRVVDIALVLLAADAFGGAQKSLEMATSYVKERKQFGRSIGAFQAVKHLLANMAVAIEPARGLYWYAAYAQDHVPGERSRVAALAKAHLSERFLQAARDMIEAHGGIGYNWDYDAHIWLKRAMFDHTYFGTPASHRARAADLAGW